MGFRKQKTLYKLVFEDEQYNGLEVTAGSVSLEQFLALQRLQAQAEESPDASEQILQKLSESLVSWNLENEAGQAQPCTYDGLKAQEFPFVLVIFQAWMSAIASVPKVSLPESNGGGTFPEQSLPMELSLPNLTN